MNSKSAVPFSAAMKINIPSLHGNVLSMQNQFNSMHVCT